MAKTKYSITHEPTYASIGVEIEDGKEDMIKEMVDFWTGSKSKLIDNDDNYTRTFLKMLCEECICLGAGKNFSLYGIISEFKDNEGWCKMDGSTGIEITYFVSPEFDDQDSYTINIE